MAAEAAAMLSNLINALERAEKEEERRNNLGMQQQKRRRENNNFSLNRTELSGGREKRKNAVCGGGHGRIVVGGGLCVLGYLNSVEYTKSEGRRFLHA